MISWIKDRYGKDLKEKTEAMHWAATYKDTNIKHIYDKTYQNIFTSSKASSTFSLMTKFVHGWKAKMLSSGLKTQ